MARETRVGVAMPVSRKLVAVVVADVAGYSRLMERDEAGTHARMRELREKLFDPKIAEHGGRTVKTTGDGMLLEFPSATSALRCAVEVQREMGVRNLYTSPGDRIELRVGINLGDIIIAGDDIIGDGVNLAARLEALAEPGGICVAAAVRHQLHDDLGIEFIDAGEQHVKNISKPVHVFRVVLSKGGWRSPGADRLGAMPDGHRHGRAAIIAGSIVAGAVLAALGWQLLPRAAAPIVASEAPLHSVMVMPFTVQPSDAVLAPLGARLTTDLTRALGDSMRDTRVTPADMAAAIRAKTMDPGQVGQEANVRYLIQGDLRPAGAAQEITVRLVDARDGRQLGTERRSVDRLRLSDDYEAMLRELTSASRTLLADAFGRSALPSGKSPTAQGLIDQILALPNVDLAARAREVRRLADLAIAKDPKLAVAWALRANGDVDLFESDFSVDRGELLAEADRDSLRAVTLDPRDPHAWNMRAQVLAYGGYTEAALAANDRARELDPTRFSILQIRGWIYLSAGKPEEAIRIAETLRSALGDLAFGVQLLGCVANLRMGSYDRAVTACERAAAQEDDWIILASLAAAQAMRGDAGGAESARQALLRKLPKFTIGRYEAKRFWVTPEAIEQDRVHVIAGLRKAGVPE